MSSWESSSSTNSVTDSTNSTSSCGSITTGYISIPQSDSSIDGKLESPHHRRPENLRQNYKGQLRIDVNVIRNYICTHIIAARNLGAKLKLKPNCFVEITILPESRVHSKCISTIYRDSSRPVFDEKVSMELPVSFESKRLLVTVYNDKHLHKNHQILGCMSFGLHRVSPDSSCQLACGWYYVLDEEIGRRRHVKVIDNAVNIKSYSSSMNVSKLLLCRTQDGGFGFSVIGPCPVRICRVKKGSTAEMHNLQQDDVILMIDSRDVSRCTAMEVSSIIRSTKHFMTVAIQRGSHYTCDKNEDRVKNGMVAKLIKKIFYSSNQNKTSMTKSSSDLLVDYGWLENEGLHSHGRAPASSNSRDHPSASLNRAYGLRKVIEKNHQPAHRDGFDFTPSTPVQRWHSKKEPNAEGYDDDDDSDGHGDDDHLQSSNPSRMSKMLSPVAECDSHLNSDSLFIGSDDDDTYEDDSRDMNNLNNSENIAGQMDPTATGNVELLQNECSQSIYDENDRDLSRSLMNDSRPDECHGNSCLDDSYYDGSNFDPRESSLREGCRSYLDENHDFDQKENSIPGGLFPAKGRRRDFASHQKLSFRGSHPLTPRENFASHSAGVFQEPRYSLKSHNADEDALSSILDTPSAPQRGQRGKAVVSKIKTIFKNRHAS